MDKRYQVFVSSTYVDLADERTLVIQTLIKADCIPAGMELFPAVDEEQFAFIKSVIDDCDYYLVIIGGRYGSLTAEGLSYTEKEYDYAVGKGLKVIALVHEDPDSIPFGKSEKDPELRIKLEAFRQKIMSGRLVNFWRAAKDLPGLVALSIMQTIKLYPAVGWVRANHLASSDALQDLNQLRKESDQLRVRVSELTNEIKKTKPALSNLAGLEDSYELSGTYEYGHVKYDWKLPLTLGEIFAAISPRILEIPNDTLMHQYFDSEMRSLYMKRFNLKSTNNWAIGAEHYQTVKVQFAALSLVAVTMENTKQGGAALFWNLTPLGRATMLKLRTVKKATVEEVGKQ